MQTKKQERRTLWYSFAKEFAGNWHRVDVDARVKSFSLSRRRWRMRREKERKGERKFPEYSRNSNRKLIRDRRESASWRSSLRATRWKAAPESGSSSPNKQISRFRVRGCHNARGTRSFTPSSTTRRPFLGSRPDSVPFSREKKTKGKRER